MKNEIAFRLSVKGVYFGIVYLTRAEVNATLLETGVKTYCLKDNSRAIYSEV